MTPDEFPTETVPDFPGHRQMLALGVGLLVALALVLVMAVRDNSRRAVLEQIVESSPIGDTSYLTLPEALPPPPYPAVASLEGQPLYPVSYKRHQKSEAKLERVGRDEARGVNIYRAALKPTESKDSGAAPTYFLKVGPGQYLKVRPERTAE
jgi:hypothetical protein